MSERETLIRTALGAINAKMMEYRHKERRTYDGHGYDITTDFVVSWWRPITGGTEYGSHAGVIRHPAGKEPRADIFWGHYDVPIEEAAARVENARL